MKLHTKIKTTETEKHTVFFGGNEFDITKSKNFYYPNKYYIAIKKGYKTYYAIGSVNTIIEVKQLIKDY